MAIGGKAAILLAAVMLCGCSSAGLKTYPVKGKVQIKDGDVALLTGGHIELKHDSDETLRPSGKITPDGDFAMETLHQGRVLPGAPEGSYKARIVLGDESDPGVPKRKRDPVHRKFLDFETSGLSLKVPSGDYNVSLSQK
jgi:hypothetical protein